MGKALSVFPMPTRIRRLYTVQDRNRLRDSVSVGEYISFYVLKKVPQEFGDPKKTRVKIEGHIVKKYPYIFELDDGKTYTWTDYMFGKLGRVNYGI